MVVEQKDSIPVTGLPLDDILDAVRSEPALAWFLAQALWVAQPALEAFWPQEKISALAERFEMESDSRNDSSRGRGLEAKRE
jgi:hypothetical protein